MVPAVSRSVARPPIAAAAMENPEEVLQGLQGLEERRRPAAVTISPVLDDYLGYVARTGEAIFPWSMLRNLLKDKLTAVVDEYREANGCEVPPAPNVPPFNCDAMRAIFHSKLDSFSAPPFTVQRICELLAHPRKHYARLDKFMRAFEKNVLVVSAKEPEPPSRSPPHRDARPRSPEPRPRSDDDVDVEMDDAPDLGCGPSDRNGPRHEPEPDEGREAELSDGPRESPPPPETERPPEERSPPVLEDVPERPDPIIHDDNSIPDALRECETPVSGPNDFSNVRFDDHRPAEPAPEAPPAVQVPETPSPPPQTDEAEPEPLPPAEEPVSAPEAPSDPPEEETPTPIASAVESPVETFSESDDIEMGEENTAEGIEAPAEAATEVPESETAPICEEPEQIEL